MSRPVPRGQFPVSCECGWAGTYTTAGLARGGKQRHSCARWQKKAQAAARRAAQLAAVDRTPKACPHKQTQHVHGTYACYVLDKCRCPDCTRARLVYDQHRNRQVAYGRWDRYRDAGRARAHIQQLMDAGMGLKRIVAVSGLSQGLLWKLMYGKRQPDGTQVPTRRVRKETEQKILAVKLDLADGACVAGVGTTRRIQALVALGWSQARLAARLGVTPGNFGPLAHGARPVTVATAKAVAALYDELSMTVPPASTPAEAASVTRARAYARTRRWPPPLAWDDEHLDDPDARPTLVPDVALTHVAELDEAAIYRRMHGDKTVRLSKADTAELVVRARRAGWSYNDIEERTGIKADRWIEAAS